MKILKQLLFTFAIVIGFSLSAFAQKGNQDRPRPKPDPPIVKPGEKPPKPNDGDKPKKPDFFAAKSENEPDELFV